MSTKPSYADSNEAAGDPHRILAMTSGRKVFQSDPTLQFPAVHVSQDSSGSALHLALLKTSTGSHRVYITPTILDRRWCAKVYCLSRRQDGEEIQRTRAKPLGSPSPTGIPAWHNGSPTWRSQTFGSLYKK
jgi:hypothetical protein